jgi:hypothetical protein
MMIIIGDLGAVWKGTFMLNEYTIEDQLDSRMAYYRGIFGRKWGNP